MPVKQVLLFMFYRTLYTISGNLRTEVRPAPVTLDSCQVLFPPSLPVEELAAPSLPLWSLNYQAPL